MKFAGKVAFWQDDVEIAPSVYEPSIVEKSYVGDVIKDYRGFQSSGDLNDSFKINNRISILSDLFAQNNWASIKYVIWNGQKIKVTGVTVEFPRIILDLGGYWNGEVET